MQTHPRNQRKADYLVRWTADALTVMKIEKYVVLKEVVATMLLAGLAWQGVAPGVGVFFIGVINTVSIAELYRAFREVQEQNRDTLSNEG